MEEKFLFSYYYKYSIACCLAYCVPVFIFFKNETFSGLWLLYLGNMCFGCLLLVSGLFVNKTLHNNASLRSLIIPGVKVIVSSIIIICVAVALMAFIFRSRVMLQAPTNYNGLYSALALNAIIVNFLLGMLLVFIGAITIKTNQRNAKGEEIT
jgi:hypothetical protein